LKTLKQLHISLKTFLLAFLLMFGYAAAQAQDENEEGSNEATPVEEEKGKHISGGYGFFSPGLSLRDGAALNSYLGQDLVSSTAFSLGGGGVLMIKSLMLGGEGGSFLKDKVENGNLAMTMESGWGKFTLGYVVYGRKGLLIYPKVGIGGYKNSLTLQKTNTLANVDTVFAGGYTGTNLQRNGAFVCFGAGFDWMPGFDETAGSGIVLGFDAGYNLGITEKSWEAYGTALNGGPTLSPNGIFVNLHIGFAGWNRQ